MIYARKWERIFWTRLVEVGVVDTHSKLPVSLWDDDRVGQPLGMAHLPYKSCVQQLLDLLTDEVLSRDGLLPNFLLYWFSFWVDLQAVLNHPPRDPGHL